ncbi:MAG: HAD family hydrolase [Alphaproteobacteria bacterium]|nr:MAG: HAD family hydrolase [Alphaproteobacteria bacterium]
MTAEIKGVLFDKDGTLHGFQESWGAPYLALLQDLAQGDRGRLAEMARVTLFDAEAGRFHPGSPLIAGTFDEAVDLLAPHLPGRSRRETVERLESWALSIRPRPVTDLAALFARLRRGGLAVGVATNDAESAARSHLAAELAAGLIDFICGSDSGFGAKPAPGMVEAFGHATGLGGRQLAVVGDSLHDLTAGRAAGAVTVAVLTGVAGREELAPHADHVLPDIAALPGWLGLDRA